jgi:hypothetical protein
LVDISICQNGKAWLEAYVLRLSSAHDEEEQGKQQ